MVDGKKDVWQGTLALMVLKTLETIGPLHGYGIARRIEQTSGDLLSVNYGTLYPALLKLEQEGYIASEWGVSDNNRKAKYYKLTRAGRKQLASEAQDWEADDSDPRALLVARTAVLIHDAAPFVLVVWCLCLRSGRPFRRAPCFCCRALVFGLAFASCRAALQCGMELSYEISACMPVAPRQLFGKRRRDANWRRSSKAISRCTSRTICAPG